jgi:hypothetical protein
MQLREEGGTGLDYVEVNSWIRRHRQLEHDRLEAAENEAEVETGLRQVKYLPNEEDHTNPPGIQHAIDSAGDDQDGV